MFYTGSFSLSFKNEYPIYENYVLCKVEESDFNLSYNPSLLKSGSNTEIKSDYINSDFSPYVSTIGLYNSNNELLMIAKLSQPIIISSETDMNFVIRYDK